MAVETKFNFHYQESRMRQLTCLHPFSSGCSLNMNIIIDMGPLSLKSSVNQSLSLLLVRGFSCNSAGELQALRPRLSSPPSHYETFLAASVHLWFSMD